MKLCMRGLRIYFTLELNNRREPVPEFDLSIIFGGRIFSYLGEI